MACKFCSEVFSNSVNLADVFARRVQDLVDREIFHEGDTLSCGVNEGRMREVNGPRRKLDFKLTPFK